MNKPLTLNSESNQHSRNISIFLNHIVSFEIVLLMNNLKLISYQASELAVWPHKIELHLYAESLNLINDSQDMERSTVSPINIAGEADQL